MPDRWSPCLKYTQHLLPTIYRTFARSFSWSNLPLLSYVTWINVNCLQVSYLLLQRKLREQEIGKIVIYTTSMTVVRKTHERCKIAKKILQNHMVRYEERDLFMNKENQKELMERLGTSTISLPQVFADGGLIGVSLVIRKSYARLFSCCCYSKSSFYLVVFFGWI